MPRAKAMVKPEFCVFQRLPRRKLCFKCGRPEDHPAHSEDSAKAFEAYLFVEDPAAFHAAAALLKLLADDSAVMDALDAAQVDLYGGDGASLADLLKAFIMDRLPAQAREIF